MRGRVGMSAARRLRRASRSLLGALALALLAQPGCAGAAEVSCAPALRGEALEPGVGFGDLRVGSTQAEVEALLGPPESRQGDAWEYPTCGFALVFDRAGRAQRIFGGDGTGGGAELAERFTARTEGGVGMGSSRQEVVAAFGEPAEARAEADHEWLSYPGDGIQWLLRKGVVRHVTIHPPR